MINARHAPVATPTEIKGRQLHIGHYVPDSPSRLETFDDYALDMRTHLRILGSLLLAGCSAADQTATSGKQPDVQKVAQTYKSLSLVTKEPVYVDPILAMLCRGARQAEVEEARKSAGPHAHTAISIYMNELAVKAFGKPNGVYPVGSIIVKEKRALGYRTTTQPMEWTKANNGVGGMIKRAAGYDAAHRDWEYFYFEDATKIESGRINSCVQCHSGASNKDFVFGGWVAGNDREPASTRPPQ